jgi:hypothetical protein
MGDTSPPLDDFKDLIDNRLKLDKLKLNAFRKSIDLRNKKIPT